MSVLRFRSNCLNDKKGASGSVRIYGFTVCQHKLTACSGDLMRIGLGTMKTSSVKCASGQGAEGAATWVVSAASGRFAGRFSSVGRGAASEATSACSHALQVGAELTCWYL